MKRNPVKKLKARGETLVALAAAVLACALFLLMVLPDYPGGISLEGGGEKENSPGKGGTPFIDETGSVKKPYWPDSIPFFEGNPDLASNNKKKGGGHGRRK